MKMAEYRFWFEKSKDEKRISRNLEHDLYNDGSYQTVPQPQNMNAYDPWADWFNAGLDPGPFTDNFGTEADQGDYFNYGVNPSYNPMEPGQTAPWQTVSWDQALNPLWFQEGPETQDQTGELPTGESGEQDRPDQDEGEGEGEGENFILAEPEISRGEEHSMADPPYGLLKEEDPAGTGDPEFLATETGVAPGIKMAEETKLMEETALKEEEETELKVETESKEESAIKEENRLEEETIDKEAIIDQEKIMRQAETVNNAENKEEAGGRAEPISREDTRNEQKSEMDQRMIVWRKFPPKSI